MPVGGSMSASSLVVSAGARSRSALLYAAVVMALVVVVFSPLVERVAMPALAGLLIVVGVGTIKPARIESVARTGSVPFAVMVITLILTLVIPLQYAVLAGVGISVLMFVIRQSSRLVTRRLVLRPDGRIEEAEPPAVLPAGEVVVLQPYGAIFFATAPVLLAQLPVVGPQSRHSVVVLRLRGLDDAGSTMLDVLQNYAATLRAVDSRLVIVTDNERLINQLAETGTLDRIGSENLYGGTSFIGETVRRAHDEALEWIARQTGHAEPAEPPPVRGGDRDWGDWPPDQMGP